MRLTRIHLCCVSSFSLCVSSFPLVSLRFLCVSSFSLLYFLVFLVVFPLFFMFPHFLCVPSFSLLSHRFICVSSFYLLFLLVLFDVSSRILCCFSSLSLCVLWLLGRISVCRVGRRLSRWQWGWELCVLYVRYVLLRGGGCWHFHIKLSGNRISSIFFMNYYFSRKS